MDLNKVFMGVAQNEEKSKNIMNYLQLLFEGFFQSAHGQKFYDDGDFCTSYTPLTSFENENGILINSIQIGYMNEEDIPENEKDDCGLSVDIYSYGQADITFPDRTQISLDFNKDDEASEIVSKIICVIKHNTVNYSELMTSFTSYINNKAKEAAIKPS